MDGDAPALQLTQAVARLAACSQAGATARLRCQRKGAASLPSEFPASECNAKLQASQTLWRSGSSCR